MTVGNSSSSNGTPGLRHNGERYRVYDLNVEMHEDWRKTSQVVDIIYPSGPDGGVRIMYELEGYENYRGGETVRGYVYHLIICFIDSNFRLLSDISTTR